MVFPVSRLAVKQTANKTQKAEVMFITINLLKVIIPCKD